MKILVFRIGFLGDTLVALPALWAVRAQFPGARIDYLSEGDGRSTLVDPAHVLPHGSLITQFYRYPIGGLRTAKAEIFKLWKALRRERYDALVYLPPRQRTPSQRRRDVLFFRAAGIKDFFGVRTSAVETRQILEADYLLESLLLTGVRTATPGSGRTDLGLSCSELEAADAWLQEQKVARLDSQLVALGPGSKMESKKWPLERYLAVCKELVQRHKCTPVIFGGKEDVEAAKLIQQACRAGIVAAGGLSIRLSAAVMQRCLFYLGNDTGTMHLAAMSGLPCVALFSARDIEGRWSPYGDSHIVLRKRIECENCMLETCPRQNECLAMIEVPEVVDACERLILNHRSGHRSGEESRDSII